MTFCALIPDRSDRPELTAFCLKQLSRMSISPDKVYHINYPPRSEQFDLIDRVTEGIFQAQRDGIDWIFIIENDDAYPSDYFERYLPHMDSADFIGDDQTYYYNIITNRWSRFDHPYRSSLFTTAFRISALNNFEWPDNSKPFLDINIWKYARFKRRKFVHSGAIGIKHGLGLCGGKGHLMKLHNPDPDMKWLKGRLSDYHIEFYEAFNKVRKQEPA